MTEPIPTPRPPINKEPELLKLTELELDLIYQCDYPLGQAFYIMQNIDVYFKRDSQVLKKLLNFFMEAHKGTEQALISIKSLKNLKPDLDPGYSDLEQSLIGSEEQLINIIGCLTIAIRTRDLTDSTDLRQFKDEITELHAAILPFMSQVGLNPIFESGRQQSLTGTSSRPKRSISDYLR